jgi:hypothetical protein
MRASVACAFALMLSPAAAAAPSPPGPPSAGHEPPVFVAVCAEPGSRLPELVSGWLADRVPGIAVVYVAETAVCRELADGDARLPDTVDVAVGETRTNDDGTITASTRVAFSVVSRLETELNGRIFTAALAARSIEFPPYSVADGEGAAHLPEGGFLRGIVEATALGRRAGAAETDQQRAALTSLRARALADLAAADRRDVSYLQPVTSATVKQIRASLILDGACSEDTAAGLLRAASLLVPYDAEARAAAVIGRLKESGTDTCFRVAEQGLLEGLAADRWSRERIAALAQFYEMNANANSATVDDASAVPADEAVATLTRVFSQDTPPSPHVLELAVAVGLAKTVTLDFWRTAAPTAHIEATIGRDRPGFGVRFAATLPWTRELTLGRGVATWTRLTLGGGPRYRARYRRFYLEGDLALLVAPTFAKGQGFDQDFTAFGLDAGAGLGGRVGLRMRGFSIWLGIEGSYFFARHLPFWPDLTIRVANATVTETLSDGDVNLMVGVSQMLWR